MFFLSMVRSPAGHTITRADLSGVINAVSGKFAVNKFAVGKLSQEISPNRRKAVYSGRECTGWGVDTGGAKYGDFSY